MATSKRTQQAIAYSPSQDIRSQTPEMETHAQAIVDEFSHSHFLFSTDCSRGSSN